LVARDAVPDDKDPVYFYKMANRIGDSFTTSLYSVRINVRIRVMLQTTFARREQTAKTDNDRQHPFSLRLTPSA
jgi:hypothetical protein